MDYGKIAYVELESIKLKLKEIVERIKALEDKEEEA